MSLGTTLVASFLVTLARPVTWPLALAAFLVRGGLLLVLAPIIVIPSAIGVSNVVAPLLTSLVLGGLSPALAALIAGLVLGGVVWLVGGGLLAAGAEAELARIVAADEDIVAAVDAASTASSPRRAPHVGVPSKPALQGAARVLAVRLLALIPLFAALSWGSARIVDVAYRELTVPSDVVTPIALRVVRGAPEAVLAVGLAWFVGQVIGAMAARRVTLRGEGVPMALGRAVGQSLRHPVRSSVLELVPLLGLAAVIVPTWAASSFAVDAVRASLATGGSALLSIGLVGLLVALWSGGLVLIAVASAWRAAAWTADAAGTFGVSGAANRGTGTSGASLAR